MPESIAILPNEPARHIDWSAPEPWRPWGGDPCKLAGGSELVRGANALADAWVERNRHLEDVKAEPERARQALMLLHQEYLAELERASLAGEISTLAPALEAKRDSAEADTKATRFQDAVNIAGQLVEDARLTYENYLVTNSTALLAEITPEAVKVTRDIERLRVELAAKLAPLETRWCEILVKSQKAVGFVTDGPRRSDFPAEGEYDRAPVPSAESLAR
ncbi:MAG: hypothetical protein ABSG93_15155 [Solirubrobacteraceae bacterium]|jgi:hypothetical protein